MVKLLKCKHCNYVWATRRKTKRPKVCPKCKSYNWDKEPQKKYKKKV